PDDVELLRQLPDDVLGLVARLVDLLDEAVEAALERARLAVLELVAALVTPFPRQNRQAPALALAMNVELRQVGGFVVQLHRGSLLFESDIAERPFDPRAAVRSTARAGRARTSFVRGRRSATDAETKKSRRTTCSRSRPGLPDLLVARWNGPV